LRSLPLQCHSAVVIFLDCSGIIMKKFVVVSLTVLAGFAAVAEPAIARDGRVGFFDRLFGTYDRPRVRVERRRAWWEDPAPSQRIIRGGRDNPVKIAQPPKKKKKPVYTVPIDPEDGENLGMGNLDYVPPKQVSMYFTGIAKMTADTTDASAIRLVLADRATTLRATAEVRKAVLDYYMTSGFKPVWTENGNINARGLAVLDVLAKATEEGLEPLRYKPAVLESFKGAVAQLDGDGLGLAQFDVGLTVAAVTYAMHVSGGAYEPERLSAYHDIKPERVSPDFAVKVLAKSPYPAEYLKLVVPTHPAYIAMRTELAQINTAQTPEAPQFPDGKRVRIGQKDARIGLLRDRLIADNYISVADAEVADDKRNVLDKELAKALKRLQEAKGVGQTSNLDSATVKALNGPNLADVKDKLLSSMERVRWLPKDLGSRYAMVNQASYRVNLIEDGKVIWASNVIVGKPMTQTAVFDDTFETVVFNPTWGVPQSIILKEYLPKLRANPGYIDKIGFKVVSANGKVVSSRSINWNLVGSNSGIGITQPAGDGNALGEVKFLFPNKHSIYMHDTPNRDLFSQSTRNFSHGCVRVENPREFAEVLLGMDRAEVDANIESGETSSVKVSRSTHVHLAYFTAWPDENGVLQYHSDAYGRDATLKKARALMANLSGANAGAKVVENATSEQVN
jgi:L,D-transpeptidase YcbB